MELSKVEENKLEVYAKQIYGYQKSIAPEIYNKKSKDDAKAEIKGIMLMIRGIETEILKVMIKIAVEMYPTRKSENPNLQFDIHYILSQYKDAQMLHGMGLSCWEDCYTKVEDIEV